MSNVVALYIPVDTVNDGDNFEAQAQFKDSASGELSAPGSVEFRVDDITDPSAPVLVQDWTAVTADTSVAFSVVSSANAILTATNAFERKQLIVTADRGDAFQCSDQKQWIVKNLNEGS